MHTILANLRRQEQRAKKRAQITLLRETQRHTRSRQLGQHMSADADGPVVVQGLCQLPSVGTWLLHRPFLPDREGEETPASTAVQAQEAGGNLARAHVSTAVVIRDFRKLPSIGTWLLPRPVSVTQGYAEEEETPKGEVWQLGERQEEEETGCKKPSVGTWLTQRAQEGAEHCVRPFDSQPESSKAGNLQQAGLDRQDCPGMAVDRAVCQPGRKDFGMLSLAG